MAMSADAVRVFVICWLLGCFVATTAFIVRPRHLPDGLLFGIGFVIRLIPALVFRMPAGAFAHFDTESFRIVGELLGSGRDVYSHTTRHPYLPLELYIIWGARWLADHSTLAFEPLMKLPAIVADAGIPLMLAHWTGGHVRPMTAQRAALAYACNPLSTLVVAVHGQFDSLPTLFLLLGAFRLRKGVTTSAQAAGAGAFFGLAILAKTWPIMVAPLAVLHVSGWLRRGVFVASVVTVPTIGVLLYCVISGAGPLPLLHRVLNYSSVEGVWGYPLILKELHRICGYDWAWTVYEWTAARARLILGFGLAGATLAAARHPIEQGCTLVLLAFCVLTPGWGTHYAVWGLPFVLLSASMPLAASFVLTAGAISSAFFLGFGGVYFEALRFVDLNSPLWTYVADISLPLWILCGVVFGSIWRLKPWRRVPVA